jgi:hypothetical protein
MRDEPRDGTRDQTRDDARDQDRTRAELIGELRSLRRRVLELEGKRREGARAEAPSDALGRVQGPSGLVPICVHCKSVRNERGFWDEVEDWVRAHSEARFSHGICPDCIKRVMSQDLP